MTHKKQAYNLVEAICTLNNNVWDNPKGSYSASRAAALVIEEALEKLTLDTFLADKLGCANTPKELARRIVELAELKDSSVGKLVSDVGAFDSSLDTIYIEIGNLHMQGLSPAQIVDGLQVVHDANLQKANIKDSVGKIIKDTNFIGPEEALQKILDKRMV